MPPPWVAVEAIFADAKWKEGLSEWERHILFVKDDVNRFPERCFGFDEITCPTAVNGFAWV